MLLSVPIEFFFGSISLVCVLTAYIWNGLHTRVKEVEIAHKNFPIPAIQSDLAAIKKDIDWLKQFLMKS